MVLISSLLPYIVVVTSLWQLVVWIGVTCTFDTDQDLLILFYIILKLFSPPLIIPKALNCSFLGCEAMQNGGKLPAPQRNTLSPSSGFRVQSYYSLQCELQISYIFKAPTTNLHSFKQQQTTLCSTTFWSGTASSTTSQYDAHSPLFHISNNFLLRSQCTQCYRLSQTNQISHSFYARDGGRKKHK